MNLPNTRVLLTTLLWFIRHYERDNGISLHYFLDECQFGPLLFTSALGCLLNLSFIISRGTRASAEMLRGC